MRVQEGFTEEVTLDLHLGRYLSSAGGVTGKRGFQKLGVFIYLLVLLLVIKELNIQLGYMERTKNIIKKSTKQ